MLPTSEPIVCNSLASLFSSPTFRGGVAENWKKVNFFLNALLIMHFIQVFGKFRVKHFNEDKSTNKFCALFTRVCQSRLKYILLLADHCLTSNENQGPVRFWLTKFIKFLEKNKNIYETIKKYLAVTTSFPSQILLQFVRNKVTSISLQSSQEERKGLKIKKKQY